MTVIITGPGILGELRKSDVIAYAAAALIITALWL